MVQKVPLNLFTKFHILYPICLSFNYCTVFLVMVVCYVQVLLNFGILN